MALLRLLELLAQDSQMEMVNDSDELIATGNAAYMISSP